MDDVISVAGGNFYSMAVRTDGSLWAWGSNVSGRLGDGSPAVWSSNQRSPVKIMEGIAAVAAGMVHSMAVRTDGSLWTWGSNNHGRIGDGTATVFEADGTLIEDNDRHRPVRIMGDVRVPVATIPITPVPTPDTPEPIPQELLEELLEGASSWAMNELALALENNLILDDMVGNWTQPTNRLLAAEAIVRLIESVTEQTILEIAEENGFDMTDTFADTDNTAVTFLKATGISTGMDGVNFAPDGTFTRAQMVTMLGRMARNLFDVDTASYPKGSETFTDIPAWADEYIGWARAVGITDGVSADRFDSDGVLQNQHTSVFAYRAYKYFTR
jgi:hypothetical protein